MLRKTIIAILLLLFALPSPAQDSDEKKEIQIAMYRAAVRETETISLQGYIRICKVVDTIHDEHLNHKHGCPVDSRLLGIYHRIVFGNESGMNFLDMILRSDSLQVMHLAPSLAGDLSVSFFEKTFRSLIYAAETSGIPQQVSVTDTVSGIQIRMTALSAGITH
jgi:hypothetical protein